jgi:hypothetical protein
MTARESLPRSALIGAQIRVRRPTMRHADVVNEIAIGPATFWLVHVGGGEATHLVEPHSGR